MLGALRKSNGENANSEVAGTTAQPQPAPAQTPGEPKRKKHHNKNPSPAGWKPGSSN